MGLLQHTPRKRGSILKLYRTDWWTLVNAFLLWNLLVRLAAAADASFDLKAPAALTGDGITKVQLELNIKPATEARWTQNLRVRPSGGQLGAISTVRPGSYTVEFTPPRVAINTSISFDVVAEVKGKWISSYLFVDVKAPPRKTQTEPSQGPYHIQMPTGLLLGRDLEAPARLKAPADALPVLRASVGKFSGLAAAGEGEWSAIYQSPGEVYPQYVIFAAVSPDAAVVDWLIEPLVGLAYIDTETESKADVEVLVGDQGFGPFQASKDGRVTIPVAVVPGIKQATIRAVDRLGNEKDRKLPLEPPPSSQVLAVCTSDGRHVAAFVIDALGRPQAGLKPVFRVPEGAFGEIASPAAGIYVAEYLPVPESWLGERIPVMVTVGPDPEQTAACDLSIQGEEPSRINISVAETSYRAGEGTPVHVSVSLLDAAGEATPLVPIEIIGSIGSISEVRPTARGEYSAIWTLPDNFKGRTAAGLNVKVFGSTATGDLKEAIRLEPAAVSRLTVTSAKSELLGNGFASSTLVVQGYDAFENSVTTGSWEASARGTFGEFKLDPDLRVFTTSYTAPLVYDEIVDTITVRSADDTAQAQALVRILPSKRPYVLTPKVGYSTNFGKVAAPQFAVAFDRRIPVLDDQVFLGVEIGFSHSSSMDQAGGGLGPVETSLFKVPLQVRATYQYPLGALGLHLAAGGGVSWLSGTIEALNAGTTKTATLVPTFSGGTGVDFDIWGPGRLTLDVAYVFAMNSEQEAKGNVGGLLCEAGYRWLF